MPLCVLPPTTQLLLLSMSCSSGMRRAPAARSERPVRSTISGDGNAGRKRVTSPLWAAASSSSVNQFRSSPQYHEIVPGRRSATIGFRHPEALRTKAS